MSSEDKYVATSVDAMLASVRYQVLSLVGHMHAPWWHCVVVPVSRSDVFQFIEEATRSGVMLLLVHSGAIISNETTGG
jgi:hypothetical protein